MPYGHTILGKVELATPFDACENVSIGGTKEKTDIPVILLAIRGKCTFATKAFNAGRLGVAALVVIDNVNEDPSAVIPYAEPEVGMKIHIPTVLVNEADFKDITTAVQTHREEATSNVHEILLSLNFPMSQRTSVDVNFLLDISDRKYLKTFLDVKSYLIQLQEDNYLKMKNYYDINLTKKPASEAVKPYNCLTYGDHSVCAKTSGKFPKFINYFFLTNLRGHLDLQCRRQCLIRDFKSNVYDQCLPSKDLQ